MAGKDDIAAEYEQKAATMKKLVQEKLWDPKRQFFKILTGSRMAHREDSGDSKRPRHTWWAQERLGGEEWVQYDFEKPVTLSGSEVLWYHKINPDGKSGCSVPDQLEAGISERRRLAPGHHGGHLRCSHQPIQPRQLHARHHQRHPAERQNQSRLLRGHP